MCALVESDADAIYVCDSIESAVRGRDDSPIMSACCIGERGGIAPRGFVAGNSPLQIREIGLTHKTVYYATTNGTTMLAASREAALQLVLSFGNMHAVSQAIATATQRNAEIQRLLVCCSGNEGGFSLEDSFFAGAFIARYIANGESHVLTDAAQAAVCIANAYNLDSNFMGRNARHARLLRDMGFARDVEFCLQEQHFDVVPQCVNLVLSAYH